MSGDVIVYHQQKCMQHREVTDGGGVLVLKCNFDINYFQHSMLAAHPTMMDMKSKSNVVVDLLFPY